MPAVEVRDYRVRDVLTGQAMSRWYPEARFRTGIGTLVVVVTMLLVAAPASAQRPGTLDRSFGDRGTVVTTVGDLRLVARAMDVQADGSILVGGHAVDDPNPLQVGEAMVVRFTSSGGLDTSFGAGGVARIPLTRQTNMDALAVGPDGSIVLAGGSPYASSVTFIRLTGEGARDMSFGEAGVATLSVGSPSDAGAAIHDVVVQPDGKIVGAGSVGSEGSSTEGSAVIRLLADGRLDPAFGSDGVLGGLRSGSGFFTPDRATGVALDSRGNIVVAAEGPGTRSTPPGQTLVLIPIDDPQGYRFVTRSPRGYSAWGADVAIARSGRILLSGSAGRPEDFLASVFSPDLRFLASRRTNLARSHYSNDIPAAATPDRDGGVLVAGGRDLFSVGLTRYAGRRLALDRSFARDGRATISLPGKPRVQDVAVQPDGGIVVMAGTSRHDGPPFNVFLARFDGGYDKRRPVVRLAGLPRGCAGPRARLRVRVRDVSRLASLSVRIDGRRVRSVERKRVAVPLWRDGSGRHRLTVRARDTAGNSTVVRRQFRACV